jgi:tetratricopeptide (TPR) repeat protein
MRARVTTALAIVLALSGAAAAQERPPVRESAGTLVERARAAFAGGRPQEALDLARRAAEAAPRSLPAQLARGGMAEYLGEFHEAQQAYAIAMSLAPDDNGTRYRVAAFAVRIGDYDRALRELDNILATQPRSAQIFFHWAPGFMQASLLKRNPALEQFVQLQIDILMEKGDLAGARKLARRHGVAESGRPYCAEANQTKGGKGAQENISKAFRLAALAQPEAADCIWWYGQWLTDEGYMRLGRVMVEEGTRATASAANKESGARYVRIRLGGGRPVAKRAESLFLIAKQRYLRDGDVEGASRLFDESLRLSPAFARPYSYKARMAWDEGDRAGAVRWLQQGVEADPDSWRTWHNLGRVLIGMERWDEAERALLRALTLFPDDVGGRLALGRALYAQGRYADYRKETQHAVGFARGFSPQGRGPDSVTESAEFLTKFERWGPGAALPPMPDPRVILGWNQD